MSGPASSTSPTAGPASPTCSSTCSSRARPAAASARSPGRPRAPAAISTPAPPTTTPATSRCCRPRGWRRRSTSSPTRCATPSIDAEELARELQVIIQEAKRKLDTPSAVAYETLHEVMFDRHRIRRWRIGHEAQLAGFTRADLLGYYRTRYVPERTIVAIVGAVDADEALAAARAAYGSWPAAAGAVDPSPEEPPRREVRARTLRGDVGQAELVLGWRAVPPLHPDAPRARPRRHRSGLGARQLALPAAPRGRHRHLGGGASLRAYRGRGVQRQRGAAPGSGGGGARGDRGGRLPAHPAGPHRGGADPRPYPAAGAVGAPAGVDGRPGQRARGCRGTGRCGPARSGVRRTPGPRHRSGTGGGRALPPS